MGVTMLPRLAARVWSTTTRAMSRVCCATENRNRVKGTRAIRATSLVTNMEEKKHSSTSARLTKVQDRSPLSSRPATKENRLARCSPATHSIRQKSSPSTRRSTYSPYAMLGGTATMEAAAASAAMHSTGWLRTNPTAFTATRSRTRSAKGPRGGLKRMGLPAFLKRGHCIERDYCTAKSGSSPSFSAGRRAREARAKIRGSQGENPGGNQGECWDQGVQKKERFGPLICSVCNPCCLGKRV